MITLLLLMGLELILGVDNILVISLIVAPFAKEERRKVRLVGLGVAFLFRIGMILTLVWISHWQRVVWGGFSIRQLFFLIGGVFLFTKSIRELIGLLFSRGNLSQAHQKEKWPPLKTTHSYWGAVIEIVFFDMIFSLDSVMTAIGMTSHLFIMILAVVCSFIGLLFYIGPIGEFILAWPSLKIVALISLLLIALSLISTGLGYSI